MVSIASTIRYEKMDQRPYLFDGRSAPWKTLNALPHDLGDPGKFSSYVCVCTCRNVKC